MKRLTISLAVSRIVIAILFASLHGLSSTAVSATLQWKFAPGDQEQYRLSQSARLISDESKTLADVRQDLELQWKVLEVAGDGSARVSLLVSSYSFLGKGPDGQEVRYDSESSEEAQGYAAMLMPVGKRLAESTVELTMSPRGEVSDVKLPDELSEAMKSVPSGKKFAEDGGLKNFEVLARLGAPLMLPEGDITANQEWSMTREVEIPVLGQLKAEFKYRIAKPPTESHATIDQSMSVVSTGGDASTKFADEKSSGTIEFNIEDGRPETSTLSYEAKLQSSDAADPMMLEYSVEFRRVVDETQ